MARISVQTEDFNIGAEFAALTAGRADIGGIGCFVGTVRANAGEPVAAMTLEHYPAMTERSIARITEEAERRWQLLGCTVIHRVGRLTGLSLRPRSGNPGPRPVTSWSVSVGSGRSGMIAP